MNPKLKAIIAEYLPKFKEEGGYRSQLVAAGGQAPTALLVEIMNAIDICKASGLEPCVYGDYHAWEDSAVFPGCEDEWHRDGVPLPSGEDQLKGHIGLCQGWISHQIETARTEAMRENDARDVALYCHEEPDPRDRIEALYAESMEAAAATDGPRGDELAAEAEYRRARDLKELKRGNDMGDPEYDPLRDAEERLRATVGDDAAEVVINPERDM